MTYPATAELEWLEFNLGLWDWDALPCSGHREGEVCQRLVGHKGRAEECRKGPPHGVSETEGRLGWWFNLI